LYGNDAIITTGYVVHLRHDERNTVTPEHVVRIIVHRPSVESGIPFAPKTKSQTWEYPYADMNVGDSFRVMETETKRDTVNGRIHVYNKHHPETLFQCRTAHDEHGKKMQRVWRTR
jgi:hypothetical protein|tara:strand:- start:381 stop:728 length:348 start_codon:yes stop_codon:yes gene_type:complete